MSLTCACRPSSPSVLSLQWSSEASDGGQFTSTNTTTATTNTSASPLQQLVRACRAVAARAAPRQQESAAAECPSVQVRQAYVSGIQINSQAC